MGKHHTWTEAEKAIMRELAGHVKDEEIFELLSRTAEPTMTRGAVRQYRTNTMGIRKNRGRGISSIRTIDEDIT
jgi:hypothetical protein